MKYQTLEDLIDAATLHLKKMSYSTLTVDWYLTVWRGLKKYMIRHKLDSFSERIGTKYINDKLGSIDYDQMTKKGRYLVRAITTLVMFQETGQMKRKVSSTTRIFDGEIGLTMTDFFEHQSNQGLSPRTKEHYRLNLHEFLQCLTSQGISSLKSITYMHLLNYISTISEEQEGKRSNSFTCGRMFFKYLREANRIEIDLNKMLPKNNFIKKKALPSHYSKEEIEKVLSTIDRSNPKGKRDYAMMLLASRLGLRSSDICNLRFNEIYWESNLIKLTQQKTKIPIELPLIHEVGEAIIDYLKYGRPISDEPYVFLHVISPYRNMANGNLYSIAGTYFRRAGFNHKRRRGVHALRNSLAGILLKKQTPVSVISGILGHENIESTMHYLRIDIESLRQCALDIPPVSNIFYEQKGGCCYE